MTRGAQWLTLALLAAAITARAADIPYLSGRVVDNAEILKPATREQLTATLEAHERSTGNQIAVLTVPTINGEPVEDYTTRVFAGWKLGKKGRDNGVLIVVVPRDRKTRIEVGYGLEGTLTDLASGRIIRDVMTPRFKAGDYDLGIGEGVRAIVAQLEGRGDAPGAAKRVDDHLPWPGRILVAVLFLGIIGLFTVKCIVTPGPSWFAYLFLMPFWALGPVWVVGLPGAIVLLGIYVIGYPLSRILLPRTAWYQKAAMELETKGSTRIGGFVIGGSDGSSGGSSSDGGGFSGGGGGSGGGGSSGTW